jgi:hypothetical protein
MQEEIAELESRRDTDREIEGFTPAGRLKPKEARAVLSIRMSASERREIAAIAATLGRDVSEFIRDAALKEARLAQAGIDAARAAVLAKA